MIWISYNFYFWPSLVYFGKECGGFIILQTSQNIVLDIYSPLK